MGRLQFAMEALDLIASLGEGRDRIALSPMALHGLANILLEAMDEHEACCGEEGREGSG